MILNNRKAITIMEIIVSCILISLCVSGLSATFIWAKRTNVVSQRQVEAVDFAKETLEEVLIKDYTDAEDMAVGTYAEELPEDCKLRTNFSGNRTYTVSLYPDGSAEGSEVGKQIRISVTWTEETGPQQEDLYGLILKP